MIWFYYLSAEIADVIAC